jgi:O-antigen/teichoic acid export membrane protein
MIFAMTDRTLTNSLDNQPIELESPLEGVDPARPRPFFARLGKNISRLGLSHTSLSLLDQAIVSGTSFLTTLVIGRICGAEELGIYSLAFTVIVLVTNLQSAVFTSPYTIYGNKLASVERQQYAGSVLLHCVMLMILSSVCMASLAVGIKVLDPSSSYVGLIWILTGALPLFLLREFVRRFAFAHLRIGVVLVTDIVASAVQLLGLGYLLQNDQLTTVNAYLVMGTACAIAAGGALNYLKDGISIRFENVFHELQKSWLMGRWLAATRLTTLGQMYAVHWTLAAFLGSAATGVYSASMTLLLAANPFIIGIGNLLEPKAARAMADGGAKQLRVVVWKATQLLGGIMGVYCSLLVFTGGWLVSLLYVGKEYDHQGPTVAMLALAALVSAWETGAVYGLRVLERPDLSFRASLLSLGVTLALAFLLVPFWGIFGGAFSVLVGDAAAAAVRWIMYSRLSKLRASEQPVH